MNLLEFLRAQEIYTWDIVLFGDGSGTQNQFPGAYGTILIDKTTGRRQLLAGAMSHASVNFMELQAYVAALGFHYREIWKDRRTGETKRVFIFTDSEVTQRCGNGVYRRQANQDLWALFDWYVQRGYICRFIWIPRDTHAPNKLADKIAGQSRKAMVEILKGYKQDELYQMLPESFEDAGDVVEKCQTCHTPLAKGEKCPICSVRPTT